MGQEKHPSPEIRIIDGCGSHQSCRPVCLDCASWDPWLIKVEKGSKWVIKTRRAWGSCGDSENIVELWEWHWDTQKEIPGRCVGVSLKEGQRQYIVEHFHVPGWVPLHGLGMRLTHLLSLVTLGLYSSWTFSSHTTPPCMTLDLMFQVFLQNMPGGILVLHPTTVDGFGWQQQAEGKHLRLKLVLKEPLFQVPHRKSLSFLNAPACNVLLEKVL